MSVFV